MKFLLRPATVSHSLLLLFSPRTPSTTRNPLRPSFLSNWLPPPPPLSSFNRGRTSTSASSASALAMATKTGGDDATPPPSSSCADDGGGGESSATTEEWAPNDSTSTQGQEARSKLEVWPLDGYNAALLNEVHPRNHVDPEPPLPPLYDLVVIGAGAGGLVSSKQAARRGAKSVMISERLAGGDCLNVGCVPSKALIRCARAAADARRASEFGIVTGGGGSNDVPDVRVDFPKIMERLRRLRATIAPADGHAGTTAAGAQVFQGRGRFVSPTSVEVNGRTLNFRKAVVATGGRPSVPPIEGLAGSPYTTNENLFNLEILPPRMVILGSGVVALEMAQTFRRFGSDVTVVRRSGGGLFESRGGDDEAGDLIMSTLEEEGVKFLSGMTTREVRTLRVADDDDDDASSLPLLGVSITAPDGTELDLECECLLVATGRTPNVEDLGLDEAGVKYDVRAGGVVIDDNARSVSNPNVYAVGDCAAGVPRLTHMSGEMAKVVVQNSLFDDDWRVSDLVVPAVMYTEPEVATVGLSGARAADRAGVEVDVYRAGLEHNDRAILESDNRGFVKIFTRKGTGTIVGATVVAARAGEIINEITLAMKHGIGLDGIGRNIHSYPTTGEAVMGCGLQFINSKWKRLNEE